MGLKDVDTLELVDRYDYLVQRYAKLSLELAPILEKFGKYKKELQFITVELVGRGVDTKDPAGLKKLVEREIEKRKDESKKADSTD